MVFGRLLPREDNFFELFNQHGQHIAQGADAFMAMVKNYDDVALRERHAAEVIAAEHAADKITAEVHRLLHRTFITPLDRDQIHRLINAMDDVLDLLQDSSEVMSLYDLQHLSEDVVRLSEISVRCCSRVQHVLTLLPKLKDANVAESVLKTCEEIDRLESDADRVMRSAMVAQDLGRTFETREPRWMYLREAEWEGSCNDGAKASFQFGPVVVEPPPGKTKGLNISTLWEPWLKEAWSKVPIGVVVK